MTVHLEGSKRLLVQVELLGIFRDNSDVIASVIGPTCKLRRRAGGISAKDNSSECRQTESWEYVTIGVFRLHTSLIHHRVLEPDGNHSRGGRGLPSGLNMGTRKSIMKLEPSNKECSDIMVQLGTGRQAHQDLPSKIMERPSWRTRTFVR
jgi:hypothetical protein